MAKRLKPLFLFKGEVNEKLFEATIKPLTKEEDGKLIVEGALNIKGEIEVQDEDNFIYSVKVKEDSIMMKIFDRWYSKKDIEEMELVSS